MRRNNLIAGQWTKSQHYAERRSPSDLADVIAGYALGTADDVDAAVEAAQSAFPSWSRMSLWERAQILDRAGDSILRRKDELAQLLAREEGKILPEALAEVIRGGQIFKFFAGEALRIGGESIASVRFGVDVEIRREPLGVVGLITPWNFPVAIPAWKVAPALAYGNCVILKPAGNVPGCAWELANILVEAGTPAGTFSLIMGGGGIVGDAIINHPGVAAVSFTGSVKIGKGIALRAAELGKKIQLEMGGKNPLVVAGDAELAKAVACAVNGAFFSTGQRCTASSRIIVVESLYDAFVDEFLRAARELRVGHALDPKTKMGPVVDEKQLASNMAYIELAKKEGCEVVGGELLKRETDGFYQEPAIFLRANNKMRSSREEIFGPCASVIRVADFDEAVEVANDTPFGLSAGICTTSLKLAQEFKHRAEAGMVMINLPTAGVDFHVPFGGKKGSSYGPREQGSYAREFYTSVKTAYVAA
ncbi:MAG: aldehyde dehydrogenase family protein [Bradyrhizobiaceae bacterium]|nr:aldehyde dehydrogenase family protein [Bradyrhizobiaceae bacterium]